MLDGLVRLLKTVGTPGSASSRTVLRHPSGVYLWTAGELGWADRPKLASAATANVCPVSQMRLCAGDPGGARAVAGQPGMTARGVLWQPFGCWSTRRWPVDPRAGLLRTVACEPLSRWP